ncbi:MAG TPA: CRISPR-associated helicase Cas3' [Candidatus Kapabacteria bacterium]|nr:CRISPR-associated helicase Cas3' [Candidatus Kapabacteria bacterium]
MIPSEHYQPHHETWRLFWAKTDRSGERPEWTRPLWAHLIDVANVAMLIWERVLPRSTAARLAHAVGLAEDDAGRWFALQIGLHDIGKAIPCFQSMHQPSRLRLEAMGLQFKAERYERDDMVHHGHASIPILIDWLSSRGREWDESTIEGIAAMIGFHHGKLATRNKWTRDLRRPDVLGIGKWRTSQVALLDAIIDAWGAKESLTVSGKKRMWPAWLMELAGWCTLADWLGSMETVFPEPDHADSLSDYVRASRAGARRALDEAGFASRAALRMKTFGDLFRDSNGNAREPRPLQQVVIDDITVGSEGEPTLTIVEAPTGEGKTEAALYLTLRQQADDGVGFYIAMPSQATSNGLFARVQSFIACAHDGRSGAANLVLVHGSSMLHPAQDTLHKRFIDARRTMAAIYDESEEGSIAAQRVNGGLRQDETRVETASWFMPKKRSLLAPYGVGTVDQALLSVLYAKHFFLRQIGLAGKTVVFDEVHAYDTYMNALFHRLLAWLRQNGTNVILLSATLPNETRRRMIEAWTGQADEPATDAGPDVPYPIVWHLNGASPNGPSGMHDGGTTRLRIGYEFPAALSQSAHLEFARHEPDMVAESVVRAARDGAAVAVIVNTVARAQAIFRKVLCLLKTSGADNIETHLFHARFPFEIRSGIEAHVLERFGPERSPGVPAILVATQVAEQSLDIDVDMMFSDLAPIDLLLQRAGRLHRHEDRHKTHRPASCTRPMLYILLPEHFPSTLPNFNEISGRGNVYDDALLNRTWWLLRSRSSWSLPDDYRRLIEAVYSVTASTVPDDLEETSRERWEAAEQKLRDRHLNEEREAEGRLVPEPGRLRSMVDHPVLHLAEQEDAPTETHPAYLALTRLGGPSFDVVCLHEDARERLWLNCACTEPLPSGPRLSVGDTRRFMECSVRLSGNHLVAASRAMNDERWTALAASNPALLRYHVMVFRDGHWHDRDTNSHFEYNTTYGIIRHTTKES